MRRSRQVAYSLLELQSLSGIRKERLARVLLSNGVQLHYTGAQKKRIVFVSELEMALPALVDSVRFKHPEGDDDDGL